MAEAPTTPAPAAAAPADAPKPKQKGLIRWGVLIFLAVAFLGFAFVGGGPTIKWAVQKYGSQGLGAAVHVESASLNVFKMAVTIDGFRVEDPVDPSKNQFEAKQMRAKLDPLACLRGQLVIDELALIQPKGRIVRNTDGSINGRPPEEKKPGESEAEWKRRMEEQAKKRDLVEDVKNLIKKIKEKRDEVAKKKQEEEERRKREGVPTDKAEFRAARADWLREQRPFIVVRRVIAEGVQIELEDKGSGTPPQTITNATLELKEFSSSPRRHDKPFEMKLDGEVAGAPGSKVKLDGKVDLTGEDTASTVSTLIQNLPLAALDGLWKDAIPVSLQGKTIGSLELPLNFKNWEIDWKPALLLDKIDAKARDPQKQIAGFPSSRVAEELTNAGKLVFKDIRIYGPIWAPKIEGDIETIKQLLLEGGKAMALKQAQQQLDKFLDKNPQAQQGIEKGKEALQKTGLDKTLGTVPGVSDLFGGKKDAPAAASPTAAPSAEKTAADKAGEATKGATDAIGDFFGGKKKK